MNAADPAKVWYQGGRFSLWSGIPVQARRHSAREIGQPRDVDYGTGCAMLLRRATIQQVGSFDVRFFAYCEDLDLSIRARKAGFRVVYVPTSIVYHDVAEGSSPSALRVYYSTRNLIEVMRKHSALGRPAMR